AQHPHIGLTNGLTNEERDRTPRQDRRSRRKEVAATPPVQRLPLRDPLDDDFEAEAGDEAGDGAHRDDRRGHVSTEAAARITAGGPTPRPASPPVAARRR